MNRPSGEPIPIFTVDAFAERPFAGNPAAVCLLGTRDWPDDRLLRSIAAEMNLSETAFCRQGDPGRHELRWFTPADTPDAEVELCGHATLATAHVLWETDATDAREPLTFATRRAGDLTCRRDGDGDYRMRFPRQRCTRQPPPPGLIADLGLDAADVAATAFGPYDWIVELRDAAAVRSLTPDFAALARHDARGVAVTAPAEADRDADFVSRFFAPRLRIAEDPVTGSLHCVLGPYWSDRLGRTRLLAEQASRRGGRLGVDVAPDHVELTGQAHTVLRGTLQV